MASRHLADELDKFDAAAVAEARRTLVPNAPDFAVARRCRQLRQPSRDPEQKSGVPWTQEDIDNEQRRLAAERATNPLLKPSPPRVRAAQYDRMARAFAPRFGRQQRPRVRTAGRRSSSRTVRAGPDDDPGEPGPPERRPLALHRHPRLELLVEIRARFAAIERPRR
jgi:hypothetical protein